MKAKQDIEGQLRQAILTAGMTRYRLSIHSGVSQGVLSNFVNRKRGLTLETAAKLAAVLGLELKATKRPRKRAGKGR